MAAASDEEFKKLVRRLERAFPLIAFELIEDAEMPGGYYIATLSSGPEYMPDLKADLPLGWRFSGWSNPDQRNNMGVVMRARGEK